MVWKFVKRYRNVGGSALLLTLPMLFLYLAGRRDESATYVDKVLIAITSPATSATNTVVGKIRAVWDGYVRLVNLKGENQRLRRRVAQLTHRNEELAVIASRVREYKRAEDFLQIEKQLNPQRSLRYARVIGKDLSPYFRVLRISIQGADMNAVRPRMPVITYDGVVGQIERVSARYAEIMLLADSRSRISVKNGRTGLVGLLVGRADKSNYLCRFRFNHPTDSLLVGDRLVTTGYDKVYPPNLLVGTIVRQDLVQTAEYYEIEVMPSVNFSNIEEVFVMTEWEGEDTQS